MYFYISFVLYWKWPAEQLLDVSAFYNMLLASLCLCGRFEVKTAGIFLENSIKMQGGPQMEIRKRQREPLSR